MKTASKVFVILNLCWKIPLFAIYFLAALTLMAGDPVFAGMTGLVGVGLLSGMIALFIVALIFVPGIVFGFIALVRLNRAVCRDDVPTWLGVCTLIFTSLLGGIFMLCVSDRDFEPTATVSRTVYYQTVPVGQPMNGFDPNARNPYQPVNQNPYQNPNQPMYQNPYQNPNQQMYQNQTPNQTVNQNQNQYPNQPAGQNCSPNANGTAQANAPRTAPDVDTAADGSAKA